MELYFNELSIKDDGEAGLIKPIQAVYVCLKNYGITTCRIRVEDFATMISSLNKTGEVNNNIYGFLYSFFKSPFESQYVNDIDEDYYSSEWSHDGVNCYGMAVAYLMNSASLSLFDDIWNSPIIPIDRDGEIVQVRNICNEKHCIDHREWLESGTSVVLEKCAISPSDKSINLREDHGKDQLMKFAQRLVNSEYVCAIINSIPFQGNRRRFIKSIKEDGVVEIVLPWTDKGYGLAVKTTGRNKRETARIAELLKEKYGQL